MEYRLSRFAKVQPPGKIHLPGHGNMYIEADGWNEYFTTMYPLEASRLRNHSYSAPRELRRVDDVFYMRAKAEAEVEALRKQLKKCKTHLAAYREAYGKKGIRELRKLAAE